MNLWGRFLLRLIGALLKKPKTQDLWSPVRSKFRVWPVDIDFNLHLNNGRFLSIMDLARFDFISQVGILKVVLKNRWLPILSGCQVRFFRSLYPFQKFEVITRFEGWDAKWFYLRQDFYGRGGKHVATGLVRGLFRKGKENISPEQVMTAAGLEVKAPQIPVEISLWLASLESLLPDSTPSGNRGRER